MISVRKIKKAYDKLLFDDLSFEIEDTGVYQIVGRSGVGKSTLLNIILKSVKPDGGTVLIDGVDIKEMSPADLDSLFSSKIGYLKAGTGFAIRELSFARNLAILGAHDEAQLRSLSKRLNFTTFNKPLNRLSGGERKKAELILLFLKDYDYLFLDEPLSYLDVSAKMALEEMINEYGEKHAVVFINHDTKLEVCKVDHTIDLDRQKVIDSPSRSPDKKPQIIEKKSHVAKIRPLSYLRLFFGKFIHRWFENALIFLGVLAIMVGGLLLPDSSTYHQTALDKSPYQREKIRVDPSVSKPNRVGVLDIEGGHLYISTDSDYHRSFIITSDSVKRGTVVGRFESPTIEVAGEVLRWSVMMSSLLLRLIPVISLW